MAVEDAPAGEGSLTSVLNRAFPNGSVFTAGCIRESLGILAIRAIDFTVVDLDLPDEPEIARLQERSGSDCTWCVIATIYDDDHLMQAFAAGASGFLLKDQPERVLVQQMRLLAAGIPPLAPSIARRLLQLFSAQRRMPAASIPQSRTEAPADPVGPSAREIPAQLTAREIDVLRLIGKGMQITEVARLLKISANTACSHVKNIYRKRQISSRAEAALEAQRLGLL